MAIFRDPAEKVGELLDDPVRARAMGEAGRNQVLTHFGWPAIADDLRPYRSLPLAGRFKHRVGGPGRVGHRDVTVPPTRALMLR
jgi:hypothetical protein